MEVRPLQAADHREAARIVTDALLHDPGWLSVGPKRAAHRRFVAERYHRAAVRVTARYGGPIYGAFARTGSPASPSPFGRARIRRPGTPRPATSSRSSPPGPARLRGDSIPARSRTAVIR